MIDPSFADTSLLLPRQRATVISHMIARCGLNPIYSQELEEKERQCEDECVILPTILFLFFFWGGLTDKSTIFFLFNDHLYI